MIVIEAKLKGSKDQYARLDEAIRTAQFIRNRCLRYWMENKGVNRNDLQVLDRDHNAAKNILCKGLKMLAEYINSTVSEACAKRVGHSGTRAKSSNAQGETDPWLVNRDVNHLSQLVELGISENLESLTKPLVS